MYISRSVIKTLWVMRYIFTAELFGIALPLLADLMRSSATATRGV
jgi:hypothetical protein